eukprot:3947767-Alexandrium_andersonii.AAC.1
MTSRCGSLNTLGGIRALLRSRLRTGRRAGISPRHAPKTLVKPKALERTLATASWKWKRTLLTSTTPRKPRTLMPNRLPSKVRT